MTLVLTKSHFYRAKGVGPPFLRFVLIFGSQPPLKLCINLDGIAMMNFLTGTWLLRSCKILAILYHNRVELYCLHL